MGHRARCAAFAACLASSTPAWASDGHTGWSATLYGGPWTQRVVSQIVEDGNYDVSGAMAGLAVDRRLLAFGAGFSLAAEGEVTQNFAGPAFTTFAFGLGVRYDNFPWDLPTSIAAFSGPSYAIDPPIEQYQTDRHQHPFLNYVALELAVGVPHHARHWDAVIRIFHRSGAWGVYSINADEGSTIGVGIRARF